MDTLTPDAVAARARELAASGTGAAATDELVAAVGGDRGVVEAARDQVAGHLHDHVDDFAATAALQLLNRALAAIPRDDPLDWRVRWGQRFRRP